jgi:predicted DNA-binding transcriptional regulator AlpA
MQKLLTLRDLLPLLQVSEATIRRWLAETRRGAGNFPKPVNGFKRKLLFRPEDIESWAAAGRQQQPVRNIETASQRSKRHATALDRLRAKGVSVTPNPNKKEAQS